MAKNEALALLTEAEQLLMVSGYVGDRLSVDLPVGRLVFDPRGEVTTIWRDASEWMHGTARMSGTRRVFLFVERDEREYFRVSKNSVGYSNSLQRGPRTVPVTNVYALDSLSPNEREDALIAFAQLKSKIDSSVEKRLLAVTAISSMRCADPAASVTPQTSPASAPTSSLLVDARKASMLPRADAAQALDIRRATTHADLDVIEPELRPAPPPKQSDLGPSVRAPTVTR